MNAVSPPSKESASACPLRVRRIVAWEAIAAGTGTGASAAPFAALQSALVPDRASLRVFALDTITNVLPPSGGLQLPRLAVGRGGCLALISIKMAGAGKVWPDGHASLQSFDLDQENLWPCRNSGRTMRPTLMWISAQDRSAL
jgi:hypothetical protein